MNARPGSAEATIKRITEASLNAYKALGCRDFSRVDFRVAADGTPYFLEVNPLPGLNPESGDLPIMSYKMGWTYNGLSKPYLKLRWQDIGNAVESSYNLQRPFTDSPIMTIGEEEAITGVLEEVVAVKKALLELGHSVEEGTPAASAGIGAGIS